MRRRVEYFVKGKDYCAPYGFERNSSGCVVYGQLGSKDGQISPGTGGILGTQNRADRICSRSDYIYSIATFSTSIISIIVVITTTCYIIFIAALYGTPLYSDQPIVCLCSSHRRCLNRHNSTCVQHCPVQ